MEYKTVGALVRGETQARLLALLSSIPGQELHTRELIRRTGASPRPAQLALERLERGGIIESHRVGNQRMWRMRPDHPLYRSIRDIFARTRGVPARLAEALAAGPGVSLAFLFGSYVTAQDDPTSDIDLFVVGGPDWVALSEALRVAGSELGREVNPVVWSEEDLARPAPSQRAFLDEVLRQPMMWLVGDREKLERIRAGVGADVEPDRRARAAVQRSRQSPRRKGRAPSR